MVVEIVVTETPPREQTSEVPTAYKWAVVRGRSAVRQEGWPRVRVETSSFNVEELEGGYRGGRGAVERYIVPKLLGTPHQYRSIMFSWVILSCENGTPRGRLSEHTGVW